MPVTLVASRTFSIPSCLSHSKLTSQLVLARSTAALFFCGATAVAALSIVRARLIPHSLAPQAPVRLLGRACRLTAICIDRSSSVIEVSGIKIQAGFSSAMKAQCIEKLLQLARIIFLKLKC